MTSQFNSFIGLGFSLFCGLQCALLVHWLIVKNMGGIFRTDINIKFLVKMGENANDIYKILQQVYSKGTVSKHIFLFTLKISRWKGKHYRIQKIYDYCVSGHYPLSCFYLRRTTFQRLILSLSSCGTYSVGPNR
jgi:hypothetical protein